MPCLLLRSFSDLQFITKSNASPAHPGISKLLQHHPPFSTLRQNHLPHHCQVLNKYVPEMEKYIDTKLVPFYYHYLSTYSPREDRAPSVCGVAVEQGLTLLLHFIAAFWR